MSRELNLLGKITKKDIERHLDAGANVNARDSHGYTLLHRVASFDHPDTADIVALLIDAGADLHVRTKIHGATPLHNAIRQSSLDVAKAFIGAITKTDIQDADGWDHLLWSVDGTVEPPHISENLRTL